MFYFSATAVAYRTVETNEKQKQRVELCQPNGDELNEMAVITTLEGHARGAAAY